MATDADPGPPAHQNDSGPGFESALAELEQIVQQLESGSLGLEPSLARFEQGIALLRRCYETLEQAEQRIELLTGYNTDGQPLTAAFPAAAEVEVSIAVERTEVVEAGRAEAVRPPASPPRARSVEQRRPETDEPEIRGPTLF